MRDTDMKDFLFLEKKIIYISIYLDRLLVSYFFIFYILFFFNLKSLKGREFKSDHCDRTVSLPASVPLLKPKGDRYVFYNGCEWVTV